MSRRHTPHLVPHRLPRTSGISLALFLAVAAALPSTAMAQRAGSLEDVGVAQLLEYRDAGGELVAVPPGISITFVPGAGVVKGESACGSYDLATYDEQPGTRSLTIFEPIIEAAPCDVTAQAVDDAYFGALRETASYDISGSILRLYDLVGEQALTFTSALIPNDPTISRWTLERLGAPDGSVEPVIPGVNPWIEFLRGRRVIGEERGGRMVGSSGCGSFLGSWQSDDNAIEFSDIAYRLEGCTSGLREQAEAIVTTLADVTDFQILPAGLALEDADGNTRMALTPDIDLGELPWTPVEILSPGGEPYDLGFATVTTRDRLSTSAVQFVGAQAQGRSICRPIRGSSLRSGLALSVADVQPLSGGCSDKEKKGGGASNLSVEEQFSAGLQRAASHALRGSELELLDIEGRPIMRLQPQPPLVGPTWVLKDMRVGKTFVDPDLTITAKYDDNVGAVFGETIWGETRQDDYSATFRRPIAAQIDIGQVSTVEGYCDTARRSGKPRCRQQAIYFDLLQSADGYTVTEGELKLLRGSGAVIRFEPAQR